MITLSNFRIINITSDKRSDQNNERIYHVIPSKPGDCPSKMDDVAILLFVQFNFIIGFWNMFLFLKSIYIACFGQIYALFIWVLWGFFGFFFKKCIRNRIQWYIASPVFWKKCTFMAFHYLTLLVCCEETDAHIIELYLFLKSTYFGENVIDIWGRDDFWPL